MPIENEQKIIDRELRHHAICNFRIEHNKVECPNSFKCQIEKYGQCRNCNLQNVFTPFDLCSEMVGKLKEYAGDLGNKDILAFNLEFIEILVYEFGVSKERIWFLTDCKAKAILCFDLYKGVNIVSKDYFDFMNEKNMPRKFDCVIQNPPFQDPNNKRAPLWQKFAEKSIELCKEGGFVCSIHPCAWRKPRHSLLDTLREKQLKYLEIHNQQDGLKTFGCGTRYDWYIICNQKNNGETTIVIDENGKAKKISLLDCSFVPHAHLEILENCLAKKGQERVEIIHSFSMYENRSPWISKTHNSIFKYPCVYSTPCKKPPQLLYSSKKDGHFGVKKVIIGKASPENGFYDEKGEYGVMNNCFAIKVKDSTEAKGIIEALSSKNFRIISDVCKWAGFAFQYEVFLSFRKDFWKEFVS